jgi:hypothetical protein
LSLKAPRRSQKLSLQYYMVAEPPGARSTEYHRGSRSSSARYEVDRKAFRVQRNGYKWSDFQFVMMSYCGLLHADIPQWMEASSNSPNPGLASGDSDERHHQTVLYHLLVMLCKGKALCTIKICPINNGCEARRLLSVKYERASRGRSLGLLTHCMSPDMSGGCETTSGRKTSEGTTTQRRHQETTKSRSRLLCNDLIMI